MRTYRAGRHEHGQNLLIDPRTLADLTRLVAQTRGPVVEIGPGRGALSVRLAELGRSLTVVEIDAALCTRLHRVLPREVTVVNGDFLGWRLPRGPHVVVGNVPFHLTTAILRKLLHTPGWTRAVLLVQWEVARRRAGVGGATMMTAQWWPWIEFGLEGRVPRSAFRPAPNVDGGLLVMSRRAEPWVSRADRAAYRRFVHDVFTGRGHGIEAILARLPGRRAVADPCLPDGVDRRTLPKDLRARDWPALFEAARA